MFAKTDATFRKALLDAREHGTVDEESVEESRMVGQNHLSNMNSARMLCYDDARQVCSELSPNEDIISCLYSKIESVSVECSTILIELSTTDSNFKEASMAVKDSKSQDVSSEEDPLEVAEESVEEKHDVIKKMSCYEESITYCHDRIGDKLKCMFENIDDVRDSCRRALLKLKDSDETFKKAYEEARQGEEEPVEVDVPEIPEPQSDYHHRYHHYHHHRHHFFGFLFSLMFFLFVLRCCMYCTIKVCCKGCKSRRKQCKCKRKSVERNVNEYPANQRVQQVDVPVEEEYGEVLISEENNNVVYGEGNQEPLVLTQEEAAFIYEQPLLGRNNVSEEEASFVYGNMYV
jgi:hypothetical protein